jgi:hypothetical protein
MEPRSYYPPPESDWWTSTLGMKMCRKCGEDRLTHTVKDGWGVRHVCDVCSHSWNAVTHRAWQAKVPREGSTGE